MTKRRSYAVGGRASAKETYLLSGKICCGICGSNYEGINRPQNATHPKRVGYRCAKKNNSVQCNNREMGRDLLEEHVLEHLSKLVFNDKIIPELVNYYNEYQNERDKDSVDVLKQYRQQEKKLLQEINNIVHVISQTASLALSEKLQALENEKLGVEIHIRKLEQEQIRNTITTSVSLRVTG